mgnify:CR=1
MGFGDSAPYVYSPKVSASSI